MDQTGIPTQNFVSKDKYVFLCDNCYFERVGTEDKCLLCGKSVFSTYYVVYMKVACN